MDGERISDTIGYELDGTNNDRRVLYYLFESRLKITATLSE